MTIMPKQVDHDFRRRSIASAAIRVIDAVGLDAARLTDVAREGEVTTGAVTHYFASKDAVIEAALAEVVRRILDGQAAVDDNVLAADDLIGALSSFLPVDEEARRDWRVWFAFWGRAIVNERLRALHRDYYAEISRRLTRTLTILQDAGRLPPGATAADVADAVIAVIDGLGVRATFEPDLWPPARQVRVLHLLLIPILSNPGGGETAR
ncbi:MAG: TetR/AcrR family transcriptional regulator [Caulobacter sp.]|nr:TetR/AcrR family transcriptional regulator [Caulobacter sp.]